MPSKWVSFQSAATVHNDDATIFNACVAHGITPHAPEKCGLRVFDQQAHDVQPIHHEIIGGRGEACVHGHPSHRQLQNGCRNIQWHGHRGF